MTTLSTNETASATQITVTLRRFANWGWSSVLEICARRKQTVSLRQLKERDLQDIGLIENDITVAGHLPLSIDAAAVLQRASLGRSRNW